LATEEPAPGADDDGDRQNGHVVDHILIEPLPYRDPTVDMRATNAVPTSMFPARARITPRSQKKRGLPLCGSLYFDVLV